MNDIKFLENEIKILEKKCLNLFNPNMMTDLEELYFKRKQLSYLKVKK